MAYANFKPTIWSKQVQMDLAKLMVFREICNTKFQGEAGRGKTVKIVGISKPTVKDYVPGTSIAAAETPADTGMELHIDQYKYTNFLVDDVDDAQSHVDIMKSLMKGSAEQHAEAADTYIAGLVKGAKTVQTKTPKPASVGSISGSGTAESEFFTSEELDKLTPRQLDDPKIMEKAMRSMARLK